MQRQSNQTQHLPQSDLVHSTQIFDQDQLGRALKRLAHEIVERNNGAEDLVLVGLYTRGVVLADRLGEQIASIEGSVVQVGSLDVSFHRDDYATRWTSPSGPTDVPEITDKVVVLVDDVLFTGRTVRAAMEALNEIGRPRAIQLAVLIDRGHRELPIRADFVGKNLPTALDEDVRVRLREVDSVEVDSVSIWGEQKGGDQ